MATLAVSNVDSISRSEQSLVDPHRNIYDTIAQYITQAGLCRRFQGFYFCDVDDYFFLYYYTGFLLPP